MRISCHQQYLPTRRSHLAVQLSIRRSLWPCCLPILYRASSLSPDQRGGIVVQFCSASSEEILLRKRRGTDQHLKGKRRLHSILLLRRVRLKAQQAYERAVKQELLRRLQLQNMEISKDCDETLIRLPTANDNKIEVLLHDLASMLTPS